MRFGPTRTRLGSRLLASRPPNFTCRASRMGALGGLCGRRNGRYCASSHSMPGTLTSSLNSIDTAKALAVSPYELAPRRATRESRSCPARGPPPTRVRRVCGHAVARSRSQRQVDARWLARRARLSTHPAWWRSRRASVANGPWMSSTSVAPFASRNVRRAIVSRSSGSGGSQRNV